LRYGLFFNRLDDGANQMDFMHNTIWL
jgi:hypothetical protein